MSKTYISNHTLLKLYAKVFQDGVSEQLRPWTWIRDDMFTIISDLRHIQWPKRNMAGYCLSARSPVSVDGVDYWPHIIAYYRKFDDGRFPSYGIQYGLYIESSETHSYDQLTGWSFYVDAKDPTLVKHSLFTGIVDLNGKVIFEHYTDIQNATMELVKILKLRAGLSNDRYLSNVAQWHYDNLWLNDVDPGGKLLNGWSPLPVREFRLHNDRKLSDMIEGN